MFIIYYLWYQFNPPLHFFNTKWKDIYQAFYSRAIKKSTGEVDDTIPYNCECLRLLDKHKIDQSRNESLLLASFTNMNGRNRNLHVFQKPPSPPNGQRNHC